MCGCCPDENTLSPGDLVSDEMCGNFNIPCGTESIIWELDPKAFELGAQSSASVSVYYEKGCGDYVDILLIDNENNVTTLSVPQLNTRSFTLINILKVQIRCNEKNKDNIKTTKNYCKGKYCISLHYDLIKS